MPIFSRNDILSAVQRLADTLYKEPVSERCTDAAQFVLRVLDFALSSGTEEELARLVQPWLHEKLFGVVNTLKEEMDNGNIPDITPTEHVARALRWKADHAKKQQPPEDADSPSP